MKHHIKNHAGKGGTKTAKKYGSEYMSALGKRGRDKQLADPECKTCLGKGWVHIEGATKFPLSKDCPACRTTGSKEL